MKRLALKKPRIDHYDRLEARPPKRREAALMAALPKLVAHAKRHAPGFSRILQNVKPEKIKTRAALASLPVTRKSDLGALQKALPPLGGLNATPVEKLAKLFVSPGPIYEPEGRGRDWWRTARGLFAGGFRPGDRIANTFAYHFTPAGSMLEAGALALGCTVVPAGVGQTEIQVAAIRDLALNAFVGTPSFLKLIVEKAGELKVDISCLEKAQVGAEYLPSALRKSMQERGIRVSQCYASADLGLIAYESLMADGSLNDGMIIEEGLILEIVRPGTGDLSAVLPGASPCGRTNVRIKGWMGRADQSTKVRAMFVTPKQVNEILLRHAEVLRARLVVEGEVGADRMTLHCEVRSRPAGLAEALVASIRDATKLRGEVALVEPGTLPNDGKVIEDKRKYG